MNRLRSVVALAVTSLLASFVASPAAAEHLAALEVPGFVVGYEVANEREEIREEVPIGETVQDWTRMVTTQRFAGAGTRVTPTAFVEVVASNLVAGCPGARTSKVLTTPRGGRPAARMRAFCPLVAATGKPETFIMLVIAGTEDILVKQVAMRRIPTDEDVLWGEALLDAVVFCETGQTGGACGA
jgi:hypothetical protein